MGLPSDQAGWVDHSMYIWVNIGQDCQNKSSKDVPRFNNIDILPFIIWFAYFSYFSLTINCVPVIIYAG